MAVARLCVIGFPVGHSLSPRMHSAALEALGLAPDWTYEAVELAPEELESGIADLAARGFAGANVTIPHKEAALALAGEASEAAREIGASNTLTFRDGAIRAENTDAEGLLAALPSPPDGASSLVLGAGGAARAAVWGLKAAGASVSVWNRTPSRAADMAAELGAEALEGERLDVGSFDLIVNATSVGLPESGSGDRASPFKDLPIHADELRAGQLVVDLVYGRLPSELLETAAARGATVVEGLEVLVQQGAASLRLWTGLDPPIQIMRDAVNQPPDSSRAR